MATPAMVPTAPDNGPNNGLYPPLDNTQKPHLEDLQKNEVREGLEKATFEHMTWKGNDQGTRLGKRRTNIV